MSKPINILLSSNSNYARLMLVTVKSLLSTAKSPSRIRLHVIDRGIPLHCNKLLEGYAKKHNASLIRINAAHEQLKEHPNIPTTFFDLPDTGHYDRLLAPFLVDQDRVIYLDTDLLIQGDISPLWDTDLKSQPLAAVQDQIIPHIASDFGILDWEKRCLKPETKYFNSGVLCMDLKKWRKQNLAERCIECAIAYIKSHGESPPLHDQYALNVVCLDAWQLLPDHWNYFAEKILHHTAEAKIIHFAGCHKPFHTNGSSRPSGPSKYFIRKAVKLLSDDLEVNGNPTIPDFSAQRFALFITAHPPYRHKLKKLLNEWDQQSRGYPIIKVLAYDGDDPPVVPSGWQVLSVKKPFGSPAPLRNLALNLEADWIQYWDADNTPTEGHFEKILNSAFEAAEDVGLIYPAVCGHESNSTQKLPRNEDLRLGYYVDTASCWRREAILSCGGWKVCIFTEDWRLALDIQAAGWQIKKSGIPFHWQATPGNRTSTSNMRDNIWAARKVGIITLLRGNKKLLDRWVSDLRNLHLPPNAGLTIVVDANPKFLKQVQTAIQKETRFQRITIISPQAPLYPMNAFINIHARVAHNYGIAIKATPEEVILTWEDDIRPTPDALQQLSAEMLLSSHLAAVAAPYLSRESDVKIAAARNPDFWMNELLAEEVPTGTTADVGMVAGGFTLWNRAALEECPILGPLQIANRGILGWDGFLCRRLNQAKWQNRIVGNSKVEHLPL